MRFVRIKGRIVPIQDNKGRPNAKGKQIMALHQASEIKANRIAKGLHFAGGVTLGGAGVAVLHGIHRMRTGSSLAGSKILKRASVFGKVGSGVIIAGALMGAARDMNNQKRNELGGTPFRGVGQRLNYLAGDLGTIGAGMATPFVATRAAAIGMKGLASKVKQWRKAAKVMKTPFGGPMKDVSPLMKRLTGK